MSLHKTHYCPYKTIHNLLNFPNFTGNFRFVLFLPQAIKLLYWLVRKDVVVQFRNYFNLKRRNSSIKTLGATFCVVEIESKRKLTRRLYAYMCMKSNTFGPLAMIQPNILLPLEKKPLPLITTA